MANKPLFAGLIMDENGAVVETGQVGEEAVYIVNDAGFLRRIPSETIDRQVWQQMTSQIEGHEDIIAEQTSKLLGQEDIFTRALIQNQLKNVDQQFDNLLKTGFPEESRAYLGMMGFKVVVDIHGNVVRVEQPGAIRDEGEGE